jgi:hypothetical protein
VIALFKQKSPANIVLLFIFGLLIKLPLFLYPKAITATENDGRLYHALISFIDGSAMLAAVFSFLLLYIQALMLNYLVNEYRMTSRQTFLPAMASLLPEWSVLSAALVTNTFIILIFISLFRLYNVAGGNGKVYNIGLLAGITSFIFFPSLLFVLAILMGIMILRPFRLNEIFLVLMGAATPYYFYAVYLFLTGRFDIYEFFPTVTIQVPQIKRSLWLVGSTVLITIPFLIGGYYIQNHLRKMLIQARKNWSILLLFLLLAFLVPFVNSTQSFHTWVLTTAPFAAFHACAYLYPPRKWLPIVLFTAMISFILAQQYATALWH